MGQRRDGRFWQRLCDEYRNGDRTVAAVAARHGVKACTLSYHLYTRKTASGKSSRAGFLPVRVATALPSALVEVATGTGVVVRAEVGTDVEYVARLVQALRS